jgi:hypothetical protein
LIRFTWKRIPSTTDICTATDFIKSRTCDYDHLPRYPIKGTPYRYEKPRILKLLCDETDDDKKKKMAQLNAADQKKMAELTKQQKMKFYTLTTSSEADINIDPALLDEVSTNAAYDQLLNSR